MRRRSNKDPEVIITTGHDKTFKSNEKGESKMEEQVNLEETKKNELDEKIMKGFDQIGEHAKKLHKKSQTSMRDGYLWGCGCVVAGMGLGLVISKVIFSRDSE